MVKYRTKEGDVLDAVCWQYYGRRDDTTEQVLAANPGLAQHGPVLPSGLLITLPVLTSSPAPSIRLWD